MEFRSKRTLPLPGGAPPAVEVAGLVMQKRNGTNGGLTTRTARMKETRMEQMRDHTLTKKVEAREELKRI